jgi:translocator protein
MKIEMRLNWILIPLITIVVMLISRYLMMGNWQWYYALKLPPITPPGHFIQGVWQVIYVLTTGSVLIIYNMSERTRRFWVAISLYAISTGLNIYWVYLFFNLHALGLATLCAAALAAVLSALIWTLWPVSMFCSFLIIPYAAWIGFATLLNLWTWLVN